MYCEYFLHKKRILYFQRTSKSEEEQLLFHTAMKRDSDPIRVNFLEFTKSQEMFLFLVFGITDK
jgi:hypothetical protein